MVLGTDFVQMSISTGSIRISRAHRGIQMECYHRIVHLLKEPSIKPDHTYFLRQYRVLLVLFLSSYYNAAQG